MPLDRHVQAFLAQLELAGAPKYGEQPIDEQRRRDAGQRPDVLRRSRSGAVRGPHGARRRSSDRRSRVSPGRASCADSELLDPAAAGSSACPRWTTSCARARATTSRASSSRSTIGSPRSIASRRRSRTATRRSSTGRARGGLRRDPTDSRVGGDSAGGNLAAVVARWRASAAARGSPSRSSSTP